MSSRAPAAIQVENYPQANDPALGGNVEIYASRKVSYRVGVLEITGADTGLWTPDTENAAQLAAVPSDLVAVCGTKADGGAENIIVTVTGTDTGDTSAAGPATLSPPAYAPIPDNFFPRGYATDVVEGGGAAFKTVTAVAATNATIDALNTKIEIWAIPAFSDFSKLGCRQDLSFSTPEQIPKSVACGFDATAYSVPGSTEELTIDLSGVYFTIQDGITRFSGRPVTLMARLVKNGGVLEVERWYFAGAYLARSMRVPAGEEPVIQEGKGKYTSLIQLAAPGT